MIYRVVLLLLFATNAMAGSVEHLGAWRNLRVQVERLPEPVLVNGLSLAVSRATGADVGVLAKRLSDKWIAESGKQGIRSATHMPWTIRSRIHDRGLEVMQWRGAGSDSELLWSRTELPADIQAPALSSIQLPAGCVTGRTVAGRASDRTYSQTAARCTGSPGAILSTIRASASRQGYEVTSRGLQLQARRGRTEVAVLAWKSAGPAPRSTFLSYLQLTLHGNAP